jgi:hypothetical protein
MMCTEFKEEISTFERIGDGDPQGKRFGDEENGV